MVSASRQTELDQDTQLNIADNLRVFKNSTAFQSGILSLIANLNSNSEELENLKKMFLALDTDHSGTLTIDEIKKGMDQIESLTGKKKVSGDKRKIAEYKELMISLDTNGDGVVSFDEFITAAIDKVALLNHKNILSAFQLIDTDNSGNITIEELKAAFEPEGHEKDGELWKEIMAEVDKDGDNSISFQEFSDTMTSILKNKHAN